MHSYRASHPFRLLLAPLLLLATTVTTRADVLIFKDGFTLEGKLIAEGSTTFENGQAIWMPRGAYFVDDYARRLFFPVHMVQEPTKQPYDPGKAYLYKSLIVYPPSVLSLGGIESVSDTEPWDAKWHRKVALVPASGTPTTVIEVLTYLDPHACKTATQSNSRYKWLAGYLTSEIPTKELVELLRSYPDLKDDPKLAVNLRADRRLKIYQFLAQARYYDLASKELDAITQDFPGQKAEVEKQRPELKQLRGQDAFDAIQRARAAGQHEKAYKLLTTFAEDGLEEKLLTQYRDLRGKYEAARENVRTARQLLEDLPLSVAGAHRKLLTEAATVISAELNVEDFLPAVREQDKLHVGRLELFSSLGNQYLELRRAGKPQKNKPDELLALAISGWVLGNTAAQTNVEAACRAWEARQLVVTYLRNTEPGERRQIVEGYQKLGSQIIGVDDFVQLIAQLPPADAAVPTAAPVEQRIPEDAIGRKGAPYLLKLPPEYKPSRPGGYPVLIALHDAGGKPQDMIDAWGEEAARNGYLLVAPKWGQMNQRGYEYSYDEQKTVLDALRDLRRHYAVDSDRVFLFGYGLGANMAYDVGLSHPDLFAGVIPMSGRPKYFVNRYWGNAQFLPFYIIGGDFAGDTTKDIREELMDKWVPRGFPVIYAAYKGRGLEWFAGELPIAMDWMNRKVRVTPVQGLGRPGGLQSAYCTMRNMDNRFYWLSVDLISKRNLQGVKWNPLIEPATITAVVSERNHLNVDTSGVGRVTVWFGRGGFIDFDKPVAIYLNLKAHKVQVKPSLETLLEDVYERGDRRQPFVAKVDLKVE